MMKDHEKKKQNSSLKLSNEEHHAPQFSHGFSFFRITILQEKIILLLFDTFSTAEEGNSSILPSVITHLKLSRLLPSSILHAHAILKLYLRRYQSTPLNILQFSSGWMRT